MRDLVLWAFCSCTTCIYMYNVKLERALDGLAYCGGALFFEVSSFLAILISRFRLYVYTHSYESCSHSVSHLAHASIEAGLCKELTLVNLGLTVCPRVAGIAATLVHVVRDVGAFTVNAGGQVPAGVRVNIAQGPHVALLARAVIGVRTIAVVCRGRTEFRMF